MNLRLASLALSGCLVGCAPSLHPVLTRIEIPAECPVRLLVLPLEDSNAPPKGSPDIYREAPRLVRDQILQRLEEQSVPVVPGPYTDSTLAIQFPGQKLSWSRSTAAEIAQQQDIRYVVFGRLRAYHKGSLLGRSTRVSWDMELMDATTQHPLAIVDVDISGAQIDPYLLLSEVAPEATQTLLKAWDSCQFSRR
jgi:hypothetical protein